MRDREILWVGYGIKTALQDWDSLASIGGMQDSFEIGGRDAEFKQQAGPFENLKTRDGDKDSESDGMVGYEAKTSGGMRDLRKTYFEPSPYSETNKRFLKTFKNKPFYSPFQSRMGAY